MSERRGPIGQFLLMHRSCFKTYKANSKRPNGMNLETTIMNLSTLISNQSQGWSCTLNPPAQLSHRAAAQLRPEQTLFATMLNQLHANK